MSVSQVGVEAIFVCVIIKDIETHCAISVYSVIDIYIYIAIYIYIYIFFF